MFSSIRLLSFSAVFSLGVVLNAADNPFIGRWALTLPGNGAGWLGVESKDGALSSSVLWGGGSVVPTASTKLDGDTLIVTREQKNKEGKVATIETITAKADGDVLKLTTAKKNAEGKEIGKATEFTGKRIADIPARPDLAKVKFGEPIQLLNGKDLTGWRLLKEADNGWSVADGVLQNRVVKAKDKHFGNLRTDAEFEDFNLKTEVRTQEGSNSGIYLRGIYEVQIMRALASRSIRITWARCTAASRRAWRRRSRLANGRRSTLRWWIATLR